MSKVLTIATPGASLSQKKPAHWVLALLGKRVVRPGEMELRRRMSRGARANALLEPKHLFGDEGLKRNVRFI